MRFEPLQNNHVGSPTCLHAPMSVLGHKRKSSSRANVFRFAPHIGHQSVRLARQLRANRRHSDNHSTNLSAREITVDGTGLSSRIAKGATHEPSKQSKPRSSTEAGPT
jgi:hypothetical protein